jgi:NTP pyrophosphatase (non-canonical NTP hydrolase)
VDVNASRQNDMNMGQHFNQLSPARAERLALLAEECAEVILAVTKIQRHGFERCNPLVKVPEDEYPRTNADDLERELGHVLNAIEMMIDAGDLGKSRVFRYGVDKAREIYKWLHHQTEGSQ